MFFFPFIFALRIWFRYSLYIFSFSYSSSARSGFYANNVPYSDPVIEYAFVLYYTRRPQHSENEIIIIIILINRRRRRRRRNTIRKNRRVAVVESVRRAYFVHLFNIIIVHRLDRISVPADNIILSSPKTQCTRWILYNVIFIVFFFMH